MIYRVTARPIEGTMPAFFAALTDGTISEQKPDGAEIVASMKRARVKRSGEVEWFESCYCPAPLKHERETVYDRFMTDMETELVEEHSEVEGDSFWEVLARSCT